MIKKQWFIDTDDVLVMDLVAPKLEDNLEVVPAHKCFFGLINVPKKVRDKKRTIITYTDDDLEMCDRYIENGKVYRKGYLSIILKTGVEVFIRGNYDALTACYESLLNRDKDIKISDPSINLKVYKR